jgi:thioredoxin-dependent peroxiredoxin
MKHAVALLMMLGTLCLPVRAALDVGDSAPNFTLPAALGGKVFQYSLSEHLAKGPVVLYFFPAAFSDGCSTEARHFAEAIGQFLAADEKKTVIKAYDAAMQTRPEYANRVSYVIAPDGKVIFVHLSLNPNRHVERTLAAVAQWTKDNPRLR